MASKLLLSLGFLLLLSSAMSQDMYLQSQRYHNKWRSTFGVGGVEPIALHVQLYKGFSCKSLRSWLIEAQVGMEGMVYKTSNSDYMNGKWEKGALRLLLSNGCCLAVPFRS